MKTIAIVLPSWAWAKLRYSGYNLECTLALIERDGCAFSEHHQAAVDALCIAEQLWKHDALQVSCVCTSSCGCSAARWCIHYQYPFYRKIYHEGLLPFPFLYRIWMNQAALRMRLNYSFMLLLFFTFLCLFCFWCANGGKCVGQNHGCTQNTASRNFSCC